MHAARVPEATVWLMMCALTAPAAGASAERQRQQDRFGNEEHEIEDAEHPVHRRLEAEEEHDAGEPRQTASQASAR